MNKSTKALKLVQCFDLGVIIALIIKLLCTPTTIYTNKDMAFMWILIGLWLFLDVIKKD